MAECLNCGKEYHREPGDLGSYCEACLKADDGAILASEINEERAAEPVPKIGLLDAPLTVSLIIINILVFAVLRFKGGPLYNERPGDVDFLIHWGAQFGPKIISGEWWRLFTAMFLHANLSHLGFNMVALWIIGKQVEQVGRVRYLGLYFVSGLAGSVASLLSNPMLASVGASGAIFGLYGALLSPRRVNRRNIGSLLIMVVILILPGAMDKKIDYMGHLGGIAAGVLLGLTLSAPQDKTSPKKSWSFAAVSAVLLVAFVAGSLFARKHYGYLPDLYVGGLLFEQKKYSEAVPYMERSYRFRPNSGEANGNLGETLFRAGRNADAIPYLQKAAQLDPKQAEWYYLLGVSYLKSGNYGEAISALSQVVGTNAADKLLPLNLGFAYAYSNNRPKAEEWLKQYTDANPDSSNGNALLGKLYLLDGRTEDAVNSLYAAVGTEPANLGAQRDLGIAYMRRGNFREAEECFSAALELSKGEERDRKALATAHAAAQSTR